jgi:hypothetical protein
VVAAVANGEQHGDLRRHEAAAWRRSARRRSRRIAANWRGR